MRAASKFLSTFCAVPFLALLAALGPSCSSSGKEGCVPGQQVTCPCAGGGTGVQVCNADGAAYGACGACEPARDGSADAPTSDAPSDAPSSDASDDAPSDAANDAQGDAGSGCVYPTDGLADAQWPQPTDGTCDGGSVVTCDPTTHHMIATACASGEVCALFDVTENPDVAYLGHAGRSYAWAGCVPAGATPCAFAWVSNPPNTIPPGNWISSYVSACQGDAALTCQMDPVLVDQGYVDLWAGTATGYVAVQTCAADEACAVANAYADCYAAPLVPCSPVASSACSGDVLLDCDGNAYQKRVDCTATGQTCREDCAAAIGLSYQPAECRDPLPSGATICDPTTFKNVCADTATLTDCTLGVGAASDCFMSGSACVCYATEHPCSQIGCGFGSSNCQCADIVSQGAECIDASATLCAPATTPDVCKGTVAETCVGYLVDVDCATYGEICQVAGGHAGCIASPATACNASMAPSCKSDVLTGCCPTSGEFLTNSYQIPCAPGFEVSFACSSIPGGMLMCTSTPPFGDGCSM
jgi:hypothetical protein